MIALCIWILCAATLAAVILRPFRIPDWCWSAIGAAVLIASQLVPLRSALHAVADGWDVYLFLAGMLALAEIARVQGLFDWLAERVVPAADGSRMKLFAGTYAVGVTITALLSNDATIVLLTPAVLAAVRQAEADTVPFAFACAFVANSASFILPIANPANLLVFRVLPGPGPWIAAFGLPSVAAIILTYCGLALIFRKTLRRECSREAKPAEVGAAAVPAAVLVTLSALLVLLASALTWPVGLCAFAAGIVSLAVVGALDRRTVPLVLRHAQWSIVVLLAGLFVLVEALDKTGVVDAARAFLRLAGHFPVAAGNLAVGFAVSAADTVFNNLPVGVVARYAVHASSITSHVLHATVICVDLGPNLSVSGSLATLLWLSILRRERVEISLGQFFRVGAAITIPALLVALFVTT